MKFRGNYWLLLLVAVLAAVAVYGLLVWNRGASMPTMAEVLGRLPSQNAVTIHLDVADLRKAGMAGLLEGTAAAEEPEYRRFVTESGFDWKTDLDAVTVSRFASDWYFVVRGRFDMDKLRRYALTRYGTCRNGVCEVAGATPGRRISFYPLTPRVLLLASSPASGAVYNVQAKNRFDWVGGIPEGSAWVSFNGSVLQGDPELPSGGRLFGKVLAETQRTTFAVSGGMSGLELTMKAHCASTSAAENVKSQLEGVTAEFKKYFERVGQASSADDLSGLLLSGQFTVTEATVIGKWPLHAAFLKKLAAGAL